MTTDLFPGFGSAQLKGLRGSIFARMGGSGPALVLLHGSPQTHACWHRGHPHSPKISP
jgi:haloacetate dehalogenase